MRLNTNIANNPIVPINTLYQTNTSEGRVINLPKMAVKPKIKTIKCSKKYFLFFLYMLYGLSSSICVTPPETINRITSADDALIIETFSAGTISNSPVMA